MREGKKEEVCPRCKVGNIRFFKDEIVEAGEKREELLYLFPGRLFRGRHSDARLRMARENPEKLSAGIACGPDNSYLYFFLHGDLLKKRGQPVKAALFKPERYDSEINVLRTGTFSGRLFDHIFFFPWSEDPG